MDEQVLKVDEQHHKLRLDVYLTQALSDNPSRTFVKNLIESGGVLVNQKTVKAHHKVAIGDEVRVRAGDVQALAAGHVLPENIPLNIFYEDKYLIVINKPAGLLVHPVKGCQTGTLVNALLYYCSAQPGRGLSDAHLPPEDGTTSPEEFRPGIVHRLDRETSGLIVVAKDNTTHVRLARQFEKHRVKKRYAALVRGNVEYDEGEIDAPIGRHPGHFDKKAVSYSDAAKKAVTRYRVIDRFDRTRNLVALFPQSGRTHQLRVHMAHLGHPILGDEKYGSKSSFPRLALHAQGIGFTHPQTKQWIEFSIPVPQEFLAVKAK